MRRHPSRIASLGPVRQLKDSVLGVDARHGLPAFERTTLVDWAAERKSTVTDPDRRVVLYPDVYTNYVQTSREKAAVRVLEALGCEFVSGMGGSGRAPLSQGKITTAESKARSVADVLDGYLATDYDVVVVEPSDLAMFPREYEKLLPEATQERIADASYEVLEYVYGLLEHGSDPGVLAPGDDDGVAYHSHCQQRTLDLEPYTVAVFEELGYDNVTSDVECCGMAGSFGYKSEYYELRWMSVSRWPSSSRLPGTARSSPAGPRVWNSSTTCCRRKPATQFSSSARPWAGGPDSSVRGSLSSYRSGR